MTKIKTKGGTTFTVDAGNVTITRRDQPEITIPEADLEDFCVEYYDGLGKDEGERMKDEEELN